MSRDPVPSQAPESRELHPLVYGSMIGFTLWLVVAAWAFFDDGAYTGFLLAVVTGFFLVFIGLPVALWRTWRKHSDEVGDLHHTRFRDWARGECATWQCRLSGAEAAVQALLPIAALAMGMTAIGIVFAVVAAGT